MEVAITIKQGKGEPKVILLKQTQKPEIGKNGKKKLAQYQPDGDVKGVKAFSKVYIDVDVLTSK